MQERSLRHFLWAVMCKGADGASFITSTTHNVHACAAAGNCMAHERPASSPSSEGDTQDASCSGRQSHIDTQKPILFQVEDANSMFGLLTMWGMLSNIQSLVAMGWK